MVIIKDWLVAKRFLKTGEKEGGESIANEN